MYVFGMPVLRQLCCALHWTVLDKCEPIVLKKFEDLDVVWTTKTLQEDFLNLPLSVVEVSPLNPRARV